MLMDVDGSFEKCPVKMYFKRIELNVELEQQALLIFLFIVATLECFLCKRLYKFLHCGTRPVSAATN